jgi:hypothetical protein
MGVISWEEKYTKASKVTIRKVTEVRYDSVCISSILPRANATAENCKKADFIVS